MKYDCLVIGGGISGMTSAIIMAKKGYHTAILEKSHSLDQQSEGSKGKVFFLIQAFIIPEASIMENLSMFFSATLVYPTNLKSAPLMRKVLIHFDASNQLLSFSFLMAMIESVRNSHKFLKKIWQLSIYISRR